MSKIDQSVLEILTKRWFLPIKCRNYGKIKIFWKWLLGPFYDPPWVNVTSCKNSKKSNEWILKNKQKPNFLTVTWSVLGTPEHKSLGYSQICVKTGRCTYLFCYLTPFDEIWAKSVKRFLRYWRKGDFCA